LSKAREDGTSDLRERLRVLRIDPPDLGFEASLHRRLVGADPPASPAAWRRWLEVLQHPHGSRLLWPALGITVGLIVLLAAGLLRTNPRTPAPPYLVATEVPSTKVAMVRFNLTADVAVESARIRVSLPQGLVFWSDGKALPQPALEWTQPLAAGDNDIPIAVRGERPGRYRMTVSALVGGERVEHEVLLEVTAG
jgi:hypothetical protein